MSVGVVGWGLLPCWNARLDSVGMPSRCALSSPGQPVTPRPADPRCALCLQGTPQRQQQAAQQQAAAAQPAALQQLPREQPGPLQQLPEEQLPAMSDDFGGELLDDWELPPEWVQLETPAVSGALGAEGGCVHGHRPALQVKRAPRVPSCLSLAFRACCFRDPRPLWPRTAWLCALFGTASMRASST